MDEKFDEPWECNTQERILERSARLAMLSEWVDKELGEGWTHLAPIWTPPLNILTNREDDFNYNREV